MKHKLFTLFVLLTLLLAGMPVQPARAAGTTRYVDVDVHCSFDCGGSWATAYHDLQDALTAAVSGDQIWVAEGVYYPGAKGDRDATFTLKDGVKIYGGFDGTEGRLTDRDFSTNLTILSGDLDKNDVNTDGNFIAETTADIVGENAYHLVTAGGTDTNTVLDGFIITAGSADSADDWRKYGGGILNQSFSPLLKNLVISGNYALERGGGMLNHSNGNPTLENVTFTGNHANTGGGIHNWSDGLVLTNIIFDSNAATDSGGGMDNYSGSPSLTGVTFSNNTAEFGGGLFNAGGGNPALSQVSFSGNIANYGGGMSNRNGSAPSLSDVTFTNNQATINGGGLENSEGNPTLTNVTFDGNHAGFAGGGMSNSSESNPILTHVSFRNNVADSYGGGMSNWTDCTPLLEDVTFNDNEAGESGGGMYNDAASPVIKNVTLSNNSANIGGGITNMDSAPTLLYVTISHNHAYLGGGIYNNDASHPILHGVLIANNTIGDCYLSASGYVDATSSHNLIEDGANACGLTNGVSGNIVGLDPQLGVLADNGGDTLTHALLVDSPAIDTGENSFCPAADQRGEARPNGLYCDIGAYESNEPHPYIVSITRADPNAVNAASVDFNITFSEPVDNVHDYDFQVTATGTISGAAVTNIAGDTTNGVVTVSTGTGSGTIRLDIPAGVGIVDADDNPLSGLPYTSGETYSVRPQTFNDVPMNYWAWNFIERLSLAGITGGCGGGNYCPTNPVTRGQMAVFLLKAMYGSAYVPADATGTVFNDVPVDNIFAKWIEQLAAEGITGGCGGGNYCPDKPVTRQEMAVFLLVAKHGTGYTPPAATGVFNDVPADNPFAKWIEALAAEGITGGCGGGNFCPTGTVTRAEMAVFLVTAFNLP
ncbi:MAG: choice-of-anchor Q domain-containing protein [Chloroflexota bacterium]